MQYKWNRQADLLHSINSVSLSSSPARQPMPSVNVTYSVLPYWKWGIGNLHKKMLIFIITALSNEVFCLWPRHLCLLPAFKKLWQAILLACYRIPNVWNSKMPILYMGFSRLKAITIKFQQTFCRHEHADSKMYIYIQWT